jgi:hypothetical protein
MRVKFLALLIAISGSSLFASGVTIKLSGNQDPVCMQDEVCITNDLFDIDTDSNGGGFITAVNAQGDLITQLNFSLEYADPGCPANSSTSPNLSFDSAFLSFATDSLEISQSSQCDPNTADVADYTLSLDFLPGIPNDYQFEINLNSDGTMDPNGTGGWLPGDTFPVNTAVPEPGTLAAGASGLLLLGMGVYRRARRRPTHQ